MANGFGDVMAMIDEKNDSHKYQFDGSTTEEMQELVNEMSELNSWYKDEVSKQCELAEDETCLDCLHERDDLMNSWIMDLTDQNEFLHNLIKETKEEGNKILQKLDRKLLQVKTEGAKMKLEKQKTKICVDNLLYEKGSLEKQYMKIQEVKTMYNIKANKINENVLASEKQIGYLKELYQRLESQGIWDLQDLPLDQRIHDQLFSENPGIIGGPCPALHEICRRKAEEAIERETLRMDIRLLNENIKNKNKEIEELKEKLDLISIKSQPELSGSDLDGETHSEKENFQGIMKEMQTTVNMIKIFGNQTNLQSDDELQGFTDEFLKL